jgi:hypothetical protein
METGDGKDSSLEAEKFRKLEGKKIEKECQW